MPQQPETAAAEDPFPTARRRMVERDLTQRQITDECVLAAMVTVPREVFVPEHLRHRAYDDCALKIDSGQTISQPYTVAFMCQAGRLSADDRVLEVGTGSGYGAAVLCRLAKSVDTIERLPELAEAARKCLKQADCDNVTVHVGDGSLGLPQAAPFDAIIVTAAAPTVPQPLLDQLADGGRLIVPVDTSSSGQSMMRFTRRGEDVLSEDLGGFVFVPLIGEHGASDDDAAARPRRLGF